ncbi:ATPase family AAA domain-containing protein 1 [Apiospora sp. TS-2023a]
MPDSEVDVPTWFVDHCVKTSSQLRDQHIRLVIRETQPDAKEGPEEPSVSNKRSGSSTTVSSSPAECSEDGEVHAQGSSSMSPVQKERDQSPTPTSILQGQASGVPEVTVETSEDYELDSVMYQSLQDLVLPRYPEADTAEMPYLQTRPQPMSSVQGFLRSAMKTSCLVRITIDAILFLAAVLLPIKFAHGFLISMGATTPPKSNFAASMKPYQRFALFKQTLMDTITDADIPPAPQLRFAQTGIVLRFARPGRGGRQFLNSVVEYFARDIGADLIIWNNDCIDDLVSHFNMSQSAPSTKWLLKAPGAEHSPSNRSPMLISVPQWRHQALMLLGEIGTLFQRTLTSGRWSEKGQNVMDNVPCSRNPAVILLDGMIRESPLLHPAILTVLKDALSATTQRGSALIIATDQHDADHVPGNQDQKESTLVNLYHDFELLSTFVANPASLPIELVPSKSVAQLALLAKDDIVHHGLETTETQNVRALKREITSLMSKSSPPLLEPYNAWQFPDGNLSLQVLRQRVLAEYEVQSIAREVGHNITLESIGRAIVTVMNRIDHQNEILDWWKTAGNENKESHASGTPTDERKVEESDIDKSGFSEKVREVIELIENKYHCHGELKWEAKLLSSLVDTDSWNDIALEPDTRHNIERMMTYNMKRTDAYGILKSQIGGALFYGPPGTGKTHLARVIAKESKVTMIQISSATIEGMDMGDTMKIIKALFNLGRMVSPSIIFIDEADSLFRMRIETDLSYHTSRINQLLSEADGLLKDEESRPFLILSTNSPNKLDHAVLRHVPGRVYLGPPPWEARRNLFRIHLREERLDESARRLNLCRMTYGYSGSDIRTVCIHAATAAQSELTSEGNNESSGKRILRAAHFQEALKANSSTITRNAMMEIGRFAYQFDRQNHQKIWNYLNPKQSVPTNSAAKSKAPESGHELNQDIQTGKVEPSTSLNANASKPPINPNRHDGSGASTSISDYDIDIQKAIAESLKPANQGVSSKSEPSNSEPSKGESSKGESSKGESSKGESFKGKSSGANIKLGPLTPNSPYQPLDRSGPEIRVLQLVEGATPTSQIQCRLRTVILKPSQSFTALSYRWGDPAPNEDILLNDEPFRVTKSLANALRWVKHHWQQHFPSRDGSEFLLWADAICINQNDNAERSFQVPMMGEIYATAELVISSIASDDVTVGFALKTYRNIYNALVDDSGKPLSLSELTEQEWMTRVPGLN